MTDELSTRLRPMKLGLMFSLITLLYGFGLGAGFGIWEDDIKGHLKAEAEAAKDSVYKVAQAKAAEAKAKKDGVKVPVAKTKEERAKDAKELAAAMKKITDKSWTYFKRAHMHAAGLGTATMAACLMLAFLNTCNVLKLLAGAALGIGSLVYSFCWMLAGLKAPGLGSTGAAKESLHWIGMPAVALCVAGLLMVMLAFCHGALCSCGCKKAPDDD